MVHILLDNPEWAETRPLQLRMMASRYVLYLLSSRSPTNTFASLPSEPLVCMFCHVDLIKLTIEDRQAHYDVHLSSLDTLRAH